jgi:hypothetical protein
VTPSAEDMDRLGASASVFEQAGYKPTVPVTRSASVIEVGDPSYKPEVTQFLHLISQEPWRHPEYRSAGGAAFEDQECVRDATMNTLCAMLTFVARGERFSPRFLGDAIEAGHVLRMLEAVRNLSQDRGSPSKTLR